MLWSKYFIPTLREDPKEAEIVSHKLMMRAGLIQKLAGGLYTYLPLGFRVIQKVSRIVREELNKRDAIELQMPILQPREIWERSGRWSTMGPLMMRFKNREEKEFVLGPTHEEIITDIAAANIRSYKDLPKNFYQIQTKFRDEIRPRFGVIRAKEFIMKDSYSFHVNDEDADREYKNMYEAYNEIFKRCGLNVKPIEADTGVMGGKKSHEFTVPASSGEDIIVECEKCNYAANFEIGTVKEGDLCGKCGSLLKFSHGIEVGQVFKLGTKYSEKLGAMFLDEKGTSHPMIMGCYGIGVSRTVAAIIECNNDANGIIWPMEIAPFKVLITPVNYADVKIKETADSIYNSLYSNNIEVLMDDRAETAGIKFKDGDLIGIPIKVIIGKKFLESGQIEMKMRKDGSVQLMKASDVLEAVKERIKS